MQRKQIHLTLVLVLVIAAGPALAQSDIVRLDPVTPVYVPPLRDMEFEPVGPTGFNVEIPIRVVPGGSVVDTGVVFPNTQRELTGVGAPLPIVNFEGQSDDDNAIIAGTRIVPPDTDGGVGPNHYLQWINLIAEIYDKNGNSVLGPFPGNTFFAGLGFPCATTNNGDPITLYDQKNDRWVVSQFAINQGRQCVAVSLTDDPTGAYFAYDFLIQGANDYPKLGLWLNNTRDALTATYRNFGGPGGGISLDFQVMDYELMLSGLPAGSVLNRSGSPFLEGTLPADVDGPNYPASDAALFGRINSGGTAYDIYQFDANFPAGVPVFNLVDSVPIGPIDRGVGRVPQPSPGEGLDAHGQFTMHRMAYRQFAGFNQILATATADAGGDVGAKYWLEIREQTTEGGGGSFSVFQDGLYSPNPQVGPRLERWMGSIAADKNGNIALGYSASSSVSNPSVRYTGRALGDPAGTMRDEVTAISGGGVQTASANRWGDYSNMSVDPTDDCTFWYTTEYYANTGGFDFTTRIVSFRFPDCGATPTQPTLMHVGGSCPGQVAIVGTGFTPNSEVAVVEAANLNGFIKGGPLCNAAILEIGEPFNLPPNQVLTDGTGSFQLQFNSVAGFCFLEAVDTNGTCLSTDALDLSP